MTNQKLFDYMLNEHGVTLLVGDMHEIERIVLEDHAQYEQPASLQSLIERVEGRKTPNSRDDLDAMYNNTLNEVIEILKSTPCIQAKALRKKGTGKWYAINHSKYWFLKKYPDLWHIEFHTLEGIESAVESNLPYDAELVTVEILLP